MNMSRQSLITLEATLTAAEEQLDVFIRATNFARTAYVRELLHNSFPEHTTAVFSRRWDEDCASLVRLASPHTNRAPVPVATAADRDSLTDLQREVITKANRVIHRFDTDEDLLEFLEFGAPDNDNYYEFVLRLKPAAIPATPSRVFGA